MDYIDRSLLILNFMRVPCVNHVPFVNHVMTAIDVKHMDETSLLVADSEDA